LWRTCQATVFAGLPPAASAFQPRDCVLASLPLRCACCAGQEGKAKHAKAKHETSYKEMAIFALQQVRLIVD
jgi:hypothetical protein